MLGARYEETKEKCMETYREENRKVKRCIIQSKKEFQELFGRKMNENRKLFWKEVSNVKGEKGGELQQNKEWKWEVGTS